MSSWKGQNAKNIARLVKLAVSKGLNRLHLIIDKLMNMTFAV